MRTLFVLLLFPLTALAVPQWKPVENPWDRGLGSHRIILKVGAAAQGAKAVAAHMEWRRPDREPERKGVLVHDLQTGQRVTNVEVGEITNLEGKLRFEPTSGPGEYAVYFLPVRIEGGAFPVSQYLPPQATAEGTWLRQHGAASGDATQPVPAEVVRWEAISAYDAWTEMEVIATEDEVKELSAKERSGVLLLVPGPHQRPRMEGHLPHPLVAQALAGKQPGMPTVMARPGEHLIFPLLLWSHERALGEVQVAVTRIRQGGTPWIDARQVGCLNTVRTDWAGRTSQVSLDIPQAHAQPLWMSVAVPEQAGEESLRVSVTAAGREVSAVDLTIKAEGGLLKDHGDADPQSLSRLRWLNSTTAVDDEPVKGYPHLELKGNTIRCLGRELELGEDGLPVQIRSYFNKAVTKVMEQPTVALLARPMVFSVESKPAHSAEPGAGSIDDLRKALAGGRAGVWQGSGLQFVEQSPGLVGWTATLRNDGLTVRLNGQMEFDGSVRYRMALSADRATEITRAGLGLMQTDSPLLLGLQHETGKDPGGFDWKWDVANKHQDSIWMGAVNGGLRLQLRSDNYVRPSVNIHYKRRPLNDPPSWNAGGTGGIQRVTGPEGSFLSAFSGPFTLEPGKPLHFDFDLLITPFHTLRTKEQWSDRYYHTGGVPKEFPKYLDGAKANGANVVNIHQGNWLNPYINYPFLTWDKLSDFSKAAHDRGMRVKYYYTVRELSNWCPEIFAFRSLGDEILMSGKGGGHPWGEEHLGGNYWQAWYEPGVQDVSFLTQPMSRLHNYYIEGLRWLCGNAGCDGIYLDDIAYDRAIMLRARKVLDRFSPRGGLIDLHSWNEFHEGGAWAHCPNIFMDSMPFVDRLWFGEGHHYTGPPPEHFLVELSGIPFGLMGEMLEGGGNPWFGLVHGMTGRLGWQGDPRDVWKLWNDFGMDDTEFLGWWAEEECPVTSGDPLVKATVWKKPGAALVAVANFSKDARSPVLKIDWAALGLDPARAKLYVPPLAGLKQRAALLPPDKLPLLKPHAGVVFIVDEKDHAVGPSVIPEALGPVIMEEDFSGGPDPSWTAVISPHAKDGVKSDAGYVLNVPAHVHAFLERRIPDNTQGVSARVWQDGKDEAQQWGPGLAVVWADGKVLRANVRKDGRLTVAAGGGENLDASISSRAPVEFTIRWDKDSVKILAGGPAMGDLTEEIASFPRSQFPGQPSHLRVGKMPNSGGPQDFGEPGPTGFNRIEWIRIHGSN